MMNLKNVDQIESVQPLSADRFLSPSPQGQKISEFELINQQINSNIFEDQTLSSQQTTEEFIDKIEQKMNEIYQNKITLQNQFIIELKQLFTDNKQDKKRLRIVQQIISLFLSFYGFWKDAEKLMKAIEFDSTQTTSKGCNDIYEYILETIEKQNEVSKIICVLFPQEIGKSPKEKEQQTIPQDIIGSSFKETLLLTIIQTFNLRMNVINQDVYSWLIKNEKLNIIEILLENGRFCSSQKQSHYQQMKEQENSMLKWMHRYLIVQQRVYNNEIELLLNMNENSLQILTSKYVRYIVRYERIPTNYIVNKSLIKEAVCQQNVPLIAIMIKLDRIITQQTLHSNRVQSQVKVFLQQPDTFGIGLYFLKKMSQKHMRKTQSSEYLENILRLLEKPQIDESFALELYNHCIHPLVVCLVTSKILLKLSLSQNPFSSEMLKLSNFFLEKAIIYRDTIFDAREMSIILFKPLFPSDKPLVKALRNQKYCNFFIKFFSHPCITYLLEQKWMSTYGFDRSLLVTFTPAAHHYKHAKIKNSNSKNSKGSSFSSFQKTLKSTGQGSFSLESQKQNWIIFKDIELSQMSKSLKNNHFYQFIIYNKSVAVRTFFEFIVFLFIFAVTVLILFQFITNYNEFAVVDVDLKVFAFSQKIPEKFEQQIKDYINSNPDPPTYPGGFDINKQYDIFNATPQELCDVILIGMSYGYKPFVDYYYKDCLELMRTGLLFESQSDLVIRVCWLIFCIGANVVQKQIYIYLIRKKLDLSILDLYDLLLFGVCVSFLLTKQIFIPQGIAGKYSFDYFDYYTYILKIECCIMVFLMWLRVFLFLIRSQKIGILVKIIILFVSDLMQFIIVLFTVVIAFGTLCFILFQMDLEIFQSLDKSIFNLVAAGFGAFDFKGQNYFQSTILIIFLAIVNVILLNLLIAILNTRYEKTIQQSEMEYSLVVYNDYINMRFHPIYTSLISLPPPFNIINGILGIITFITRSRRWNRIALKLQYTLIILIPCSLVYIALSICIMPLSFLEFIYQILLYSYYDNMMNARKRNICYRLGISLFRVLTWIGLGIPYLLLVLLFHDLPLFYASAFSHNNNKYNFTKNNILDIRVIKYASLINNYLHTSKLETLNYLEFRFSLENKKEERYKRSYFQRFAQTSYQNQASALQSLRKGQKTNIQNKVQPESVVEKHFAAALKKFGDNKFKQEADNIQLHNLIRSIKYSAIFFKKSKSTSFNLSKLLYIVKKKEQFAVLLQQNSQNFFLNRSFSSHNISTQNLL